MARVLVTGGTGVVGRALVARLLERGDDVAALARSDAAARELSGRGAEVVRGDVLDETGLAASLRGRELLYHVAGVNALCLPDPLPMFHVNVRGAEIAVRAAAKAGLRRVVLTSSAASLGEAQGTVGHEGSAHRGSYLSFYERSKREGEDAAMAAAAAVGMDVVAVNPSSVQGPGRAGGTGRILIAYLNGRLPVFVDTAISLVDIDDCAEGHVLAGERGRAGERYVLNGATIGSLEALELVAELAGVRRRVRLLPPAVAMAAATAVERGFRAAGRQPPLCREMARTILHGHRYDGSRASRELGLAYRPVRDTIGRTIAWAREQGLVRGASG